ncbi:hypothetical protein EYB25_009743 [Talaromyces marneffei]|nr:hypothetical protein EYB25_009743 [Talaromyces marneffei]
MPLAHLTLTVSHLPTSTSFFLACLQPLGYKFIGRHDEYIGFGSKADEPADFWLAQEQPGTPAGAAHIAFPAPNKEAVNTFFISALKAGGTIHGEPKCRDPETGYFSAAVVDFDGNSIEAVYRPDPAVGSPKSEAGSMARSERTRGPSALQTIKNGSVVSRARSVRTTEDRAVQAAIENIPPSRVKMLDQQAPSQAAYQQQQQQQAYAPTQQSSDNSISAKTIIGTLLGATAGAAIAYAMIKSESSSDSSSPPQSSAPIPMPGPAPSQYIQHQPPLQQQQQQQQQQPHQMPMSLPMLMPMLGPAPSYQDQAQQPIYRALEAPPTVIAPSQAARSVYTANDAISAYTRSTAPKGKSPRADTIYEETEYYPPITEGAGGPRSLYSQEASTINGGGSGVRRTSNGSIYATRELPIRAIEYGMSTVSSQQSQKLHQQQQQQGHIIGEAESDFSSISTIKPVPAAKSIASSHRSSATKSSKHSSSHRHEDDAIDARSTTSSNRTAHKIALPDSRPGSTYTSATKTSKRSSASTIKETKRDRDRESLVDAYEIPLPASAAPSTVFLDAVVDITPEDSISQVGISHNHNNYNHSDNKSSSGRSHRSRSGPSSQAPSTASKREKDAVESGSIFDQPIKPSDSISQVSVNHRHSSSSHHSHHSHSHGGHRGSSRVSERSASGKKSHSGGSVRSGHY